jgi:tol-pal system protein YbgF
VKIFFGVLIALFTVACASNSNFDRLRNDVSELQRSSFESRKDIDILKEKTSVIVKEESFTAVKEGQANILARINETSGSIQELRGRFDESRYFTEKSFKEFTLERDLLRTQIAGLETQIRLLKDRLAVIEIEAAKLKEPIKDPAETSQPTGDAAKTNGIMRVDEGLSQAGPAPDSKSGAYEVAYQLFKDRKYKESREKFEVFVREYSKTDLADNAQFWIAETYFAEKDFESAILSYETLFKKYPDSDKAGSGMFKQGLAFAEIGDVKTGIIILNRLIEKYPDSKDAEAAKKKIADLDKKPKKKK